VPLTPTERERWKDAARGAGMSTAAFVRRATDKWIADDRRSRPMSTGSTATHRRSSSYSIRWPSSSDGADGETAEPRRQASSDMSPTLSVLER